MYQIMDLRQAQIIGQRSCIITNRQKVAIGCFWGCRNGQFPAGRTLLAVRSFWIRQALSLAAALCITFRAACGQSFI